MVSHPMISQAAAIPIENGRICMINSSSGRGWVIPKGHIEPHQTARETALQEAWEEAGLQGVVDDRPVGHFQYAKKGARYSVSVFLMHVTDTAESWPEDHRRTRLWVRPDQIGRLVQVVGMRRVLNRLRLGDAVTFD